MDLPTALLVDVHHLNTAISIGGLDPECGIEQPLAALLHSLGGAVPSCRGLRLTIVDHGYPVVLSAFPEAGEGKEAEGGASDRGITTSLRLPLTLIDPSFEIGSRIVFYAATPGSFVDLAADLAHVLVRDSTTSPPATARDDSCDGGGETAVVHSATIELNVDLPPPRCASGIVGLTELSTINRAVGVLLDRGHHLDEVHQTLRRQAAAADLDPYAFAARLLQL